MAKDSLIATASVCSSCFGNAEQRGLMNLFAIILTGADKPVLERATLCCECRVELFFEFRVHVDHDPS